SRMPGDIAVRNSTASISKRALRNALSMMSMVTVSTGRLRNGALLRSMILAGIDAVPSTLAIGTNQDIAEAIHRARVRGQDHGGRIHLQNDRGTADAVARFQARAVVHDCPHPLAVHVRLLLADGGGLRAASAGGDDGSSHAGGLALYRGAQSHQLVLEWQREREEPAVLGIEGLGDHFESAFRQLLHVDVHRQAESLT